MSTEATVQKRKLAIETDEAAYKAYCRYCPDHIYAWDHLTMEERLAWRNVAAHMPTEDKMLGPQEPKSLGQICFEVAWEGQPERQWPPRDAAYWEAAAQAVAVAVLHMRYDEFTPELKVAANEGIRRGMEWLNRPDGPASREEKVRWAMDQPIVDVLSNYTELSNLTQVKNAIHAAISEGVLTGLKAWHEVEE